MKDFDLRKLPEEFYQDPYPTYRWLRENDPVRRMPDGSLLLTRYADVSAVYRDAKHFSSDKRREFAPKFGPESPLYQHHTASMVFTDAPAHTRVRRLVLGALAAPPSETVEAAITARVDALLDAAAPHGQLDAIADFAAALPVQVIGDLFAIPAARRGPLRQWSLDILTALEPTPDAAQLAAGNQAVTGFLAFLADLIDARRRNPGDPYTDTLTRLIQGEGYDRLSETELLHNCIFILDAAHETTTNMIGNALEAMLRLPEARALLAADPEQMRPALEEFARFESSNQFGNRIATRDTQIAGTAIPAGTPITLCIGAANRDPAAFADPDRLDITRWPNKHLAFGIGVHMCAGITLARQEARIALSRFLARFPNYTLAAPPVRGGRARFRGFRSLPLALATHSHS